MRLAAEALEIRSVPAPLTVGDNYTLDEDATLTVSEEAGVLANDSDPDGHALTASMYIAPRYGSMTLNPDGSFTYTPQANFFGRDRFTYRASNGTTSTLGFAILDVSPVNDLPVAEDNAYTMTEDGELNVGPPAATFTTSLSMVSDGDWVGAGGTYNLTPEDGEFTATGNANLLTIRYENPANSSDYWNLVFAGVGANPLTPGVYLEAERAVFRDPGHPGMDITGQHRGSNTVTGFFNVLDAAYDATTGAVLRFAATFEQHSEGFPPALRGTVRYNAADALPVILANDRDPDGDAMNTVLVDSPAHGTVNLLPDGSFTYTPDADYTGPDSFTYRANDGQADSNLATVTINITEAGDLPTAGDDAYSTDEDTALNIAAPGVLSNDRDALTALLDSGPSHGTLALNSDGSFTYAPHAEYNGPDSFTYKASDGVVDSNIATVSITVTAVNDAPTLSDAAFSLPENSPNGTAVVTVNGSDVDRDALTYAITGGNIDGAFAIDPNTGEISVANSAALDFESTPVFDLTVEVRDPDGLSAAATVRVSLTEVPKASPVVIDIRPGDSQNRINGRSHGKIEVAILSTSDFDARQVDVGSLRFGRTGAEDSVSMHPKSGPRFHYEDVNGDGRLDLVVRFEVELTGFQAGDKKGILTGRLVDGESFTAEDDISLP